jgi:hypothetical protein
VRKGEPQPPGTPLAPARGQRRFPASARAPGAEAVRAAFAGLVRGGEAPRIGLAGNTGGGKTTAALALACEYLRASPGALIVVDNKAEGRYDGLPGARVYQSISQLATSAQGRVWVLKPDVFAGQEISPEAVAEFQWKLRGHRMVSLVLNDELVPHAARAGQWRRGFEWLPKSFVQGRSHGLAQVWCTTMLQSVPIEAAEQSSELWTFKAAGLGLRLLDDRNYTVGVPPGTVENLAGYPLPPEQRGEFLRLVNGVQWDRRVYKF